MTGHIQKSGRFLATALFAALLLACVSGCGGVQQPDALGDEDAQVIKVLLIPADGSTAGGTLSDYRPLFAALSNVSRMRFELTVTQSYGAAVEGICNGVADVAFVGPAAFLQARDRRCAELLAVGVRNGEPAYYAGIFVAPQSPARSLADLRGARIAFGDINSTSSFLMPISMLMDAGLDPVRDLGAAHITGSHTNSLNALLQGQVDAAALSLNSYDRALRAGIPGAERLRILARSDAMPYPPFIVSTRLSPATRQRLRQAFASLSRERSAEGRRLPGYGGHTVEGYVTDFSEEPFNHMAGRLARVTPAVKADILDLAAER